MKYFMIEIKKIYSGKLVIFMLGAMLAVAIIDPLFIYYVNGSHGNFFKSIGAHPFQFWILINSSGWGHAIYYTMFFLFPIISTGLVYYHEQSTSVGELMIVKGSRRQYFGTKVSAVFWSTFLIFLLILFTNLLVTYLRFDIDAPLTSQYAYSVPKEESFAYYFYEMAPLWMAVFYSALNAFVQAILAVGALGIQFLFRFKKIYTAVGVPYVLLYIINYITEIIGLKTGSMKQCIMYIVQPKAAVALVNPITGIEVIQTITIAIVCVIICVILGIKRNENIL